MDKEADDNTGDNPKTAQEEPNNNVISLEEYISHFIEPRYQNKGRTNIGIRTSVLSDFVTSHNMKIGSLEPYQRLEVKKIDVIDENVTVLNVELQEKELN